MNVSEEIDDSKSFWFVMFASGLFGALIGGIWYGSWQVVVESGQALSGVVPYENSNAFYQYHVKAWTIAHQITALLLLTGLTAKAVSLMVSAFLGTLVFSVLSGMVFVLSSHRWISLAAPFTILSLLKVKSAYFGMAYPIIMFNSHHSNGIMGRNLSIFILILLAMNYRKLGFVFLGLAPAFHITWGAWTWVIVVIWLLWSRIQTKDYFKKYLPWFAMGFSVTLLSFLVQQYMARDFPVVDSATQSRYLGAFYEHWDYHRTPLELNQPSMYMAVTTLVLSVTWAIAFRGRLQQTTESMLKMLSITSVLSIVACGFAAYPHVLPNIINLLMIGRFSNISVVALPVLVLGLLSSEIRHSQLARVLIVAHFFYLVFNEFFLAFLSSDRFGWRLPHWAEFILMGTILIAYAILSRFKEEEERPVRMPKLWAVGFAVVMLFISAIQVKEAFFDDRKQLPLLSRSTNPVIELASKTEGVLIVTSNVQVIQLQTGRPLLLNTGALDQVTNVPATGPEIARILDEVYGIDYFDPPDDIKEARPSMLLPDSGRLTWERRTPEEWGQIREKFGATQIFVSVDWELKLEPLLVGDEWALYDLPSSNKSD